jgi:hypothetical protein
MAIRNRNYLAERFKNGNIPDQQDFADTIDSALNLLEDGITIQKTVGPTGNEIIHVGINDPNPDCLLSIKGENEGEDVMICFESTDGSQEWNINLNPTNSDVKGFSIDNATSGNSTSNLFIDLTTGNVGINSVDPTEKLSVLGDVDGGYVSALITNIQSGHDGWKLAAIDDNVLSERVGAFGIVEKSGSTNLERITVLPTITTPTNTYYRTGINTPLPYSTLHVDRPEADVQTDIALDENTGIIISGSMIGQNLVLDNHQLQARFGDYVAGGPTIVLTAAQLNIQPFGGNVVLNNNLGDANKITFNSAGKMGLGVLPTDERLSIGGAATFGDSFSETPAPGTVRWHANPGDPADLMVYKDGVWKSLTTQTVTDGFWTDGGGGIIYYNPAVAPKVGIGLSTPTAALEVEENGGNLSDDSFAAIIRSEAAGIGGTTHTRAALKVETSGPWSTEASAYNVGVYVANVSGQSSENANLAAVFSGNTVIGNLNGLPIIGANGTNVLAIQTGVSQPTTIPGSTANSGIQIFSNEITLGGIDTSVFHLMTGDGEVIQLYQQPMLEPTASANNPNTGNADTDALIVNMRERINALELVLINLGLLPS